MHLHRRQPVQGFHNGFVGELQRVFHALSLMSSVAMLLVAIAAPQPKVIKETSWMTPFFHLDVHAHDVSALGVSHFPTPFASFISPTLRGWQNGP